MNGWRATKALAMFEFRRDWPGIAFAVLFALYMGTIIGGLLDSAWAEGGASRYLGWVTDWLYLFGLPMFGCTMNRTIFSYWKKDFISKRLSHLRTLPIPVGEMASSRLLLAFVSMLVAGGLFFVSQYAVSPALRSVVAPGEWLAFAVTWLCYGLIANSAYLYLEMGFSGKVYVVTHLIISVGLGTVTALLAWRGLSLHDEALHAVAAEPLLVPIAAAATAGAALYAMRLTVVRRMNRRSYTF